MFEITGNLHIHTPYSDGAKWHAEIAEEAVAAGLDFIIVTDHNIWVDGVEGYYQCGDDKVLLLVGEEVHNPRRDPQASHFLVFGADRQYLPGFGEYLRGAYLGQDAEVHLRRALGLESAKELDEAWHAYARAKADA